MSIITISPALPGMFQHFVSSRNADFLVKLMVALPSLFIGLSAYVIGPLIDRHGRLKFLPIALILYAVAGTAGLYLDDLISILVTRALLSVAVGTTMTIVVTLIGDYFEGQERQKFIGYQFAFMSFGGILFLGLGGLLADISWRWPFAIYVVSLLLIPASKKYLFEPIGQLDLNYQSSQEKAPRRVWMLFINVMVVWILFFTIPVQLPFHLNSLGVQKNILIGMAIAMSTLASVVSSFSYSRIKDILSHNAIFSLGYILLGCGFTFVACTTSYLGVLLSMFFAGLGLGLVIPNGNLWLIRIVPPAIRGRHIGRLSTFWFVGQFLSPIIWLPVTRIYTLSYMFEIIGITYFVLALLFFCNRYFLRE